MKYTLYYNRYNCIIYIYIHIQMFKFLRAEPLSPDREFSFTSVIQGHKKNFLGGSKFQNTSSLYPSRKRWKYPILPPNYGSSEVTSINSMGCRGMGWDGSHLTQHNSRPSGPTKMTPTGIFIAFRLLWLRAWRFFLHVEINMRDMLN